MINLWDIFYIFICNVLSNEKHFSLLFEILFLYTFHTFVFSTLYVHGTCKYIFESLVSRTTRSYRAVF